MSQSTETAVQVSNFVDLINKFENVDTNFVTRKADASTLSIEDYFAKPAFQIKITIDNKTNNLILELYKSPRAAAYPPDHTITVADRIIEGRANQYHHSSLPISRPDAVKLTNAAYQQLHDYLVQKECAQEKEQAKRDTLYQAMLSKYPANTIQKINASNLSQIHLSDSHYFGISFMQHSDKTGEIGRTEIKGRVEAFGAADDPELAKYAHKPEAGIGRRGYIRIALIPDCNQGYLVRGIEPENLKWGAASGNGSFKLKYGVYDLPPNALIIVHTSETPDEGIHINWEDPLSERRFRD